MIVGAGKLLKVMAGDHVNAQVLGWFNPEIQNSQDPNTLEPLQNLLVSLFTNGLVKTLGANKTSTIIANGGTAVSTGIGDFLYNQNNYMSDQGAYLNWILLDEEQLKLVESNSGFADFFMTYEMNSCKTGKKLLQMNEGEGIQIKQNGYLYIYVSNTNLQYPVYFDNLKIDHIRGSLTEETHYYPFGLTMSGISSKALTNAPQNKLKYNGKEEQKQEFSDGGGLDWLDYGARMYDNQIGRWMLVDPKAEKLFPYSSYTFCLNNPLIFVDIDGRYPILIITRSYAPFATFGPGYKWHGDNRGATLKPDASYRTAAYIVHNTETKQTFATGGSSLSYTTDNSHLATTSHTNVKNRSEGNNIDVHSFGNNAAQVGSWDIDQFTKIKVTTEGDLTKDHVLSLNGTISGDDFPNQESIVYDSKGNSLWLGNFETKGDRQWGPVTDLPNDNEFETNITVNVRIKVDKDGIFQGVITKDKDGKDVMISIADWNKKFKSDDNKK